MNNKWHQIGNRFIPSETTTQLDKLEPGVYVVREDLFKNLELERIGDDFSMPNPIYGTETEFIERIVRTYDNTSGNLGALLNGVKGTGKTITAEQIANLLLERGLPTILVNDNFEKLQSFLSGIQQDVTLIFDEYEKTFNRESAKLLTIMDGVLKSDYRKVFLLTTNDSWIHDAMMQRPGRIRYLLEFTNLTRVVIEQIIDDRLKWPELRQDLVDFISQLELITVDIVTTLTDETNIHQRADNEFFTCFNVKKNEARYDVVRYKYDEKKDLVAKIAEPVALNAKIDLSNFYEDGYMTINGRHHGELKLILEKGRRARVDTGGWNGVPEGENNIYEYELTPVRVLHNAFAF